VKKSQITPENTKTSGSLSLLSFASLKRSKLWQVKKLWHQTFLSKVHIFLGGFSLPFASFLNFGFKDCNATKRMISFHKLKRKKKKKGGRKKTWGKKVTLETKD
jgi:hypothetical protein